MSTNGPVTACQICGHSPLAQVLFLGYLPPVNTMRPIGAPHDLESWFPAELLQCPVCHLVQLGFAADPAVLFPPDYPYTSGTTRILRENFAELYREAQPMLKLTAQDLVVDIGSNDGTLLKNFLTGGHRVLGIEPSLTSNLALADGVETWMTFFGKDSAVRISAEKGKARLVTAANVFAHIPDINGIVEAIGSILTDDGVFISESHYLLDLVKTVQYDTIYHEHLRYYSLHSLKYLLELHGFHIFHVKRIPTHGGSVRVYASRSPKYRVRASVERLLALEVKAGLNGDSWAPTFRDRVIASKLKLYALLKKLKTKGQHIYAISAPSRASTLVNYVGLDDGIIDCVLEISGSKKIGKYMPGRGIPVLEESKLYADQPESVLLLAWHIADELMINLKKRGYSGDFIVPLPVPRIVKNDAVAVV
ncbi:MAG: class I SAM-dependent methyltransferase [Candidatus Peribacteraceae bacterium]|nr:class I SAM-dependent methyltransferase [Candidatus Peribacteraceae bacterium]